MESYLKEFFDVINWYYRSITKPTDKKITVAKMLKTIAYSFFVYLILTSPEKNVLRTKN